MIIRPSRFISFIVLFTFLTFMGYAQDGLRSISVTGTAAYNLSPNEIIISISYQEYFTDPNESQESKVLIEDIEKKVLKSLKKAGIKDDKITMGGATLIRPYINRIYLKRRINKTLLACINTTEDYIRLIRQLEKDQLFDEMITSFSITEYKHTEKDAYLTKSRAVAFADAKTKAELIMGESGNKLVEVISVEEINNISGNNQSFYAFDNAAGESASGFQPIIISYNLKVVFKIE